MILEPWSAATSDDLHTRVQRFIARQSDEHFDDLALELAAFQARVHPGHGRLLALHGEPREVDDIPAVPAEAFRLGRVALHPPELDVARFATSGTTGRVRGVHALRTLATYRAAALASGRAWLFPTVTSPAVVVALASPPGSPGESSLSYMMAVFMEVFDGRPVRIDPAGAAFDGQGTDRWLVGTSGVDLAGLRRAAIVATKRREPLVVLATSLALVALLELLGSEQIPAPKRTIVMQTGGFKGRRRAVAPDALRQAVARAFRVPEAQVVTEYGMTELGSQLYDGVLAGAPRPGPAGLLVPPPWLRVRAVDPVSLRPVRAGQPGLARFVDLTNVDSAVAVLTEDVIVERDGAIELQGRRAGARARGCSLAVEELVDAPAAAVDAPPREAGPSTGLSPTLAAGGGT